MSQTSPQQSSLGVVSTWTEGKCKGRSATEVAKLLDNLSYSHHDLEEFLESSTILAENLLCHVFVESLGKRILETVCYELTNAFNDILSRLPGGSTTITSWTASSLVTLLQEAMKVVQCIENLIRHLITSLSGTTSTTNLGHVLSVPINTISMLTKSYSHCKNSESLYGDLFKHTSQALGVLFQKTYSLQKSLGSVLSKIKLSSHEEDETLESAAQICEGLFDVCQVISGMDNMLLAATWKLLLGFMHEFQDVISKRLSALPYIKILSGNIQECVKYTTQLSTRSSHLLSSGDESTQKAFARSCRFSHFFVASLCDVIIIFGERLNNDACEALLSSICELYLSMNPTLRIPILAGKNAPVPDTVVRFYSEMLSECENVTQLLISKDYFVDSIQSGFDQTPNFGSNMFLLAVTKALLKTPACMHKWSEKENHCPILCLLKHIIHHAVQGREDLNKPFRGIDSTAYDAMVVNVCSLISCIPDNVFTSVEEILMENLISHEPYRSNLASDMLTFICKSSKPLCDHYFTIFSELIKAIGSCTELTFPLKTTVNFLIRITPSLSGGEFKKLEFNKSRWPWILIFPSSRNSKENIQNCIADVCKGLKEEINTLSDGKIELYHLLKLTASFGKLLQWTEAANKFHLPIFKKISERDFFSTFMKFWSKLQKTYSSCENSIVVSKLLVQVLRNMKFFVTNMESSQILSVLIGVNKIVGENTSPTIKMATAELLPKLQGKIRCVEIEEELCKVLTSLISDTNWRVQNTALDAFEKISQHTSGTSLLERCAGIPDVASKVEAHFSSEGVDSAFQAKMVSKQKRVFTTFSADRFYQSWRDHQMQQGQTFKEKYNSLEIKTDSGVLQAFYRVKESVSALDRVCCEQGLRTVDLDPSAREELEASRVLLESIVSRLSCS